MIDSAGLYDHLRILSVNLKSKKLEQEVAKSCRFLVDQYKKMGFEPYNGHSYKQKVPLENSQLQDGVISVGDDSYKLLNHWYILELAYLI